MKSVKGFFVDGRKFVEEVSDNGEKTYLPYNPFDCEAADEWNRRKENKTMTTETTTTNAEVSRPEIENQKDFLLSCFLDGDSSRLGKAELLEKRYCDGKKDLSDWYNKLSTFLLENGAGTWKMRFTNVATGETQVVEYVTAMVNDHGIFPFKYGDYGLVLLLIAKTDDCWYKTILRTDTAVVINGGIFKQGFPIPSSDDPFFIGGVTSDGKLLTIACSVGSAANDINC